MGTSRGGGDSSPPIFPVTIAFLFRGRPDSEYLLTNLPLLTVPLRYLLLAFFLSFVGDFRGRQFPSSSLSYLSPAAHLFLLGGPDHLSRPSVSLGQRSLFRRYQKQVLRLSIFLRTFPAQESSTPCASPF